MIFPWIIYCPSWDGSSIKDKGLETWRTSTKKNHPHFLIFLDKAIKKHQETINWIQLADVYCIETERQMRQGKHLETEQCGTHSQCWIPFLLLPNLLVILVLQLKFNSRSKSFSCVQFLQTPEVFTTQFQSPLFFGGELVQFPLQSPPHFTRHPLNLGIRRGDGCDVQCGARTLPNHRLGILKNAGKIDENRTYGWSPWKKMKLKVWENHGQSTVNGIFQPFFCLEASDMGI